MNSLYDLFRNMNKTDRKKFYFIQILLLLSSIAESVGLLSIAPFMSMVTDNSLIDSNQYLSTLYTYFNFQGHIDFIIFFGLFVLLFLIFGNLFTIYVLWKYSQFGYSFGQEISKKLFYHYMTKNYLYHKSNNSSKLISNISQEANRLLTSVIQPFLLINSRVFIAFIMIAILAFVNFHILLVVLIIFSSLYVFIYKIVKVKLKLNGQNITESNHQRFKYLSEGFIGYKDIVVNGNIDRVIDEFNFHSDILAKSYTINQFISKSPKFILETITFSLIIILTLYSIYFMKAESSDFITVLSIFALSGYRLLPAFQQIFSSYAVIKSNINSLEVLKYDLYASFKELKNKENNQHKGLSFNKSIEFKNTSFAYSNNDLILDNINITIQKNTIVGFVGASGSGKSTLIDILMGLIKPQSGNIYIDGKVLEEDNIKQWISKIGYVPQSIYLSDSSIMENIAFGLKIKDIDIEQVRKTAIIANIDKHIESLPEKYYTNVGERGMKLSGGQIQRIGIARALYNNPDVLIFDEATSALDSITEGVIMELIHKLGHKKTIIIIAHRINTLIGADNIFILKKGEILDSGRYNDLIEKSDFFKKIATSIKD
jgi:ATP-binding cassette, subfamily B, bacterial PglK